MKKMQYISVSVSAEKVSAPIPIPNSTLVSVPDTDTEFRSDTSTVRIQKVSCIYGKFFFLDLRDLFGKFINFFRYEKKPYFPSYVIEIMNFQNLLFLHIFAHFSSINAILLTETSLK